jgi:lysozyme
MNLALLDNLRWLFSLIRRFEGCFLVAYLCPAGVWTIGWGSTGPDVKKGTVWTQEQADARMRVDARMFALGTLKMCPNIPDEERLCGVSDFSYNLGLTRLKASTLRRRILANDWYGACDELKKWNRGGGRVLRGLVLRRAAEIRIIQQVLQ